MKTYTPNTGIRNLKRHITSAKHIRASKLKVLQTRLQIPTNKPVEKGSFHYNLIYSLVSANIPIEKINNPIFWGFLETYKRKVYTLTLLLGVSLGENFLFQNVRYLNRN